MKTMIVNVIGISSFFLVVIIQKNINFQTWEREELEESLSFAMEQTLSEVMEKNHYGIEDRNEMIAAFLQAMLRRIREDVNLTVRIHELNFGLGQMDVEILGEIRRKGKSSKKIILRRKMVFQAGLQMSGNLVK